MKTERSKQCVKIALLIIEFVVFSFFGLIQNERRYLTFEFESKQGRIDKSSEKLFPWNILVFFWVFLSVEILRRVFRLMPNEN